MELSSLIFLDWPKLSQNKYYDLDYSFCCDRKILTECIISCLLPGGYYTIEQKKSRLRIIVLNTNYMRQHDNKHSYSHLAAVRQRPGGFGDAPEYNNYHYHYGNHYRSSGGNTNGQGNGYYTAGVVENAQAGGTASALSGGEHHESEKQWQWLETVLVKSKQNKETVSDNHEHLEFSGC